MRRPCFLNHGGQWHAECDESVEKFAHESDFDSSLGRLTALEAFADGAFQPAHGRLAETASVVVAVLFRGLATVTVALSDRFVAIRRPAGEIAKLGVVAGRNHRKGLVILQFIVAPLRAVGTVAVERLQLSVDLPQQRRCCLGVVRARVGREFGEHHVRVGIDCKMNLPQVVPLVNAVLEAPPSSFTLHFQSSAVDNHVGRLADLRRRKLHDQIPGPLDQAHDMSDRHVGAQRFHQRPTQAFSLMMKRTEQFANPQQSMDRLISVDEQVAAPHFHVVTLPRRNHVLGIPERNVSLIHKQSVLFSPVG